MLRGIDVSHWNGEIRFNEFLKDIRSDFVVAKITEGWKTKDALCSDTINGCREHSILYGVYHYMHAGRDMIAQADWFIDNALDLDVVGNGILALDVEDSGFKVYTVREVGEMVERVVNRIVTRTGVYPVIYASRAWMPGAFKQVGEECAGWIASWTSARRPYRSDLNTSIWQTTSKGFVRGVEGNVDCDVFYGSAEAWSKIARGKRNDRSDEKN